MACVPNLNSWKGQEPNRVLSDGPSDLLRNKWQSSEKLFTRSKNSLFQIMPVHNQFRVLVHIGSGFGNYDSYQFKFSISVQVLVHKVPEPI